MGFKGSLLEVCVEISIVLTPKQLHFYYPEESQLPSKSRLLSLPPAAGLRGIDFLWWPWLQLVEKAFHPRRSDKLPGILNNKELYYLLLISSIINKF